MLRKSGFFNNPGKKSFKIKTKGKKIFKDEFEGLSAKELIDKFKGNR